MQNRIESIEQFLTNLIWFISNTID